MPGRGGHGTSVEGAADRARTLLSVTVTESANWIDHAAARRLGDALRSGVRAGIRHYARPGGARDQARHLVRAGKPIGAFAPGALAPALDARAQGVDDRFVKAWIKTVREAAVIRTVLVYAPYERWGRELRPDRWADDGVVLWLSRYNDVPGRPGWFHPRLGVHEHAAEGNALVYPFTLTDLLL